jgi:tRNA-dihydrouridine synthase B
VTKIFSDRSQPLLFLSPMAGYTESPFRRMVREIEPSTILVSELISAEALRRGSEKTLRMVQFHESEKMTFFGKNKAPRGGFGIQLFGSDSDAFVAAAAVVEDLGADFIDLNFGCPSPKIVNSGNGSALLKNPDSAAKMIEKLVASTSLPVTAKMRLGFFSDDNFFSTCKNFESAGISSLAVHGRTTQQKFSGRANWEKIYEVKKLLKIPVIGNGDVDSAESAVEKLGNLDGVMIGRAAIYNPWIFRQCRAAFSGEKIPETPEISERLDFFRKHAELATEQKGEKWAMIELRKHFAHLVRGVSGAASFRDRLIRVETLEQLSEIFDEISRSVHTASDV